MHRILATLGLVVGSSAIGFGQGTYTWNASQSAGGTGGTGTAWIRNAGLGVGTGENWVGGTAGKMPGVDSNTSTTIDGNANDVAVYNLTGTLTSVLGMSNSTGNGVSANGAANGRLQVGAVANATSGTAQNLTLNASSSAPVPPGILQLNGAYSGNGASLPVNTLLSASGGNLTIDRGTTNLLDVQLGVSGGFISAAANRTITITSNVGETGGARGFTKDGAGTLVLSGANTYTGGTTIGGGQLNANTTGAGNSATGTGSIQIGSGGVLAGTGNALGAVGLGTGGRVTAGLGTAVNQTLSVNSLTQDVGSTTRFVVANGSGSSDLTVAGASRVAMTGQFDVTVAAAQGQTNLELFNAGDLVLNGSVTYTRRLITHGGLGPVLTAAFGSSNGGTITASDNAVNLNPVNFTVASNWSITIGPSDVSVTFTPTPEPATVLGLAVGALGVGRVIRRRGRAGSVPAAALRL